VVVLWLGLSLLSSVCKHKMWSYYDWVYCCSLSQFSQYVVVLWLGLSLLSSVSKQNMLGLLLLCSSVNTIYGHIMIGLIVVVRQ